MRQIRCLFYGDMTIQSDILETVFMFLLILSF